MIDYRLDLASLTSVREAAAAILKSESRLDVLINNAGTKMSPKGAKTQDGFDMQFGVNYLGHYLLTQLLMPLIKKTEEAGGRPRSVLIIDGQGQKSQKGAVVSFPEGVCV